MLDVYGASDHDLIKLVVAQREALVNRDRRQAELALILVSRCQPGRADRADRAARNAHTYVH